MTGKNLEYQNMVKSLIRLNARALKLAVMNRWLTPSVYGESYDRVSETYDSNWRQHIEKVTVSLLKRLSDHRAGQIIDLGCGTGLSSRILASMFPDSSVSAVDISKRMLEIAEKEQGPSNIRYHVCDMLDFLKKTKSSSCDMVFSSWAMGYSRPGAVMAEAARVLRTGGVFAFIVNYADTLADVFTAYRKTMIAFPAQMTMAMRPSFPKDRQYFEKHLKRSGFFIHYLRDGRVAIPAVRSGSGKILPWLLGTGALAGFDRAMSLDADNPGSAYFESLLYGVESLEHHYAEAVVERK